MPRVALFLLCIVSVSACANERVKDRSSYLLEASIGQLVIAYDNYNSYEKGPNLFGSAKLYGDFETLYRKNIKELQEPLRLQFFWAALWHLKFDGHYMHEFQELAYRDLGAAIINKLKIYVKGAENKKRNTSALEFSKKVLADFKRMDQQQGSINK